MGDPSPQSFRQLIGVGPSTASPSDSTLIIIDAQNEYANGKLATVDVANTRKNIASLLQTYRSGAPGSLKGQNIVHVVHQTSPDAPVFTTDTDLAAEFEELKPDSGEKTIIKNFPSAFASTDLDEYLGGLPDGVGKKVVLVGYMAHVCVSTTARAADERGLDVILPRGAIGDRDIPGFGGLEVTEAVLKELSDAFGTVVEVGDIK
jgi:nicotinamidase-related amidase